ncbi:V-type ATP synthase subunit I [Vallitalea guaymasensis]|uniref:V-type ATP synthase subunit I n=1 Tax=Vallitalea guaymasensis TaxID=1185412 RepID=UPI002729D396|nr:V-type ATPase 116kDa subunit family protein [Vallitalea guaymasensis]
MSIEKMFFVNVAGPIKALDYFVIKNVLPYDVQLVNAISILDSVKGLYPFSIKNPYDNVIKKLGKLCENLDIKLEQIDIDDKQINCALDVEPVVEDLSNELSELMKQKEDISNKIKINKRIRKQIIPIKNVDIEINKLFEFEFMKFRFGKMPKDSFKKLNDYVEDLEVIVFKVFEEDDHVFLLYFMPKIVQESIDSLFASLYFERIRISGEVKGHPKEVIKSIDDTLAKLSDEEKEIDKKIDNFYKENYHKITDIYNIINQLDQVFDVRRHVVHSKDAFYLTGWVPQSQLNDFMGKIKEDEDITCIVEEDEAVKKTKPPTKLRNNKFFKPFESLVKMYGTPSYNELDPTPFVAITYLLMFGMMFGDMGQGFVIALLGYYVYKKKGNALGKIGIYAGIASAIFGLFYGSIFGNEELLREIFGFIPMINPMENKQLVLIIAVGFGVLLLIMAMVLNIWNAVKKRKMGQLLFDRNGITGLIFYLALIYLILSKVLISDYKIAAWQILLLIVVPLILIFLSHPLGNLIEKKKHILPEDKGGYFIEAIFELIETLLAILSNTISFIRVGAFALNHVGFFLAFHMMADMVGGTGSIFVMIFGNILIICLEGLIVGIQGLRLEYYELFSRFFSGEGISFNPFKIKDKQAT